MENIIEISNLRKSFKDVKAVDGLSFKVKKGELFALLGVNGAGKSTTISIMCGNIAKDEGKDLINGFNLDTESASIKKDLGVVFQNCVLDKALSVKDNLKSRASLYCIFGDAFEKRLDELANALDFKDFIYRPLGKLSGGQRRRIDIARALLHKPKILILDEPTTGLDPQTRKLLWNVIENLRKNEDLTVILTTHYMEDASEADFVVIIDSGKIVAEGTPIALKNAYTQDIILLYDVLEEDVKKLNVNYSKMVGGFKIYVKNTAEATAFIAKYPHIFTDNEVIKGKMDVVFLAGTGKKLSGGDAL